MTVVMRALVVSVSLFISATQVCAGDWKADCQSDAGWAADCVLSRAGIVPIEKYRARGDEFVRMFMYGLAPVIVIDIVLPKRGQGFIAVYDPTERNLRHLTAISRHNFETLRQKFVPQIVAARDARTSELVCTHNVYAEFKASVDGQAFQRLTDRCNSRLSIADDFMTYIGQFDPAFAIMRTGYDGPAQTLLKSLRLKGNRALAAKAFALADDISSWTHPDHRPSEAQFASRIEPGAALRFANMPPAIGREAFVERQTQLKWFLPASASARGRTIVVRGAFVRRVDTEIYGPVTETREFRAPSTQTWRVQEDGSLRLMNWWVGGFEGPLPEARF